MKYKDKIYRANKILLVINKVHTQILIISHIGIPLFIQLLFGNER